MEFLFNLQLFTEESEVTETEQSEESTQTEETESIPSELEGLSEETAREIMKEIEPEKKDEVPDADATSETKAEEQETEQVLDEPTQAIPYKRFKEVNDKSKAKDQEIEQLKQQLAAMKNNTPPAQQQTVTQQPVQQEPQRPQINADLAVKVDDLAFQEALRMSGLTKEEVDVLEYADDKDPKVQAWNASLSFAKTRAWNAVDAELKNIQARQQQQVQTVQASRKAYESFEMEQKKAEDFAAVQQYAVNDYFNTLSPIEQQAVSTAWNRVENSQCSPQDVFTVKQYFEKASADYRGKHPKEVKPDKLKTTTEKLKQMEQHPRVSQIEGQPSAANGLTVEKLEQIVNENNWDDIPQDIKDVLLKGGTL